MSIQSINRAIEILNLFRENRSQLGLSEIAELVGLVKTTVFTIVKTLVENGFLYQDVYSKKYSLGISLFELGMRQAGNLEINKVAVNPMHQLSNDTSSYCRLAIWDASSVFITMTVHPQGMDSHTRQLGPRLPAYCTALGKAMLAHMPPDTINTYLDETEITAYTDYTIIDRNELLNDFQATRKRAYAISNKEILLHQVGIGAPVFNEKGSVTGAVSIQLNPEEVNLEKIEKVASRLLRATFQISSDLGYHILPIQPDKRYLL